MVQATTTQAETEARLTKSVDSLPPWRHVSDYVTNAAEAKDMAVDGSGGSPQVFNYTPPANYQFIATRLVLYMETSGNMTTTGFADLGVALGQGVEIKADGVLLTTWQDNPDIVAEMYDTTGIAAIVSGGADNVLRGRWTFTQDMFSAGILVKTAFEVIINDDLSSLTEFRIKIKGKLIPV